MSDEPHHVLYLCTGNSARSIMAEVLMNHLGRGQFNAFSAGSYPTGTVNPFAIETLRTMGLPTDGLRSKSWNEFATPNAPALDFVFTVCDNAAGKVCPVWPGKPMTAHWGVEDPAAFHGPEEKKRESFHCVARILRRRIELFISLPLAKLDAMTIQNALREIGTR